MVQWPLVKSLVDFGSGFRVENFDVTDISPILQTKVYDIIDPLQLFKCLSHNVDQLQRQIENIGNLLDLKGSSEIGLITGQFQDKAVDFMSGKITNFSLIPPTVSMCTKICMMGFSCTNFIFQRKIHDIPTHVAEPSFRCRQIKGKSKTRSKAG
jgi:hypothetical protein